MKTGQLFDQITVNPKVRFGKPVITGTRVPVDLVIGKIAGGMEIPQVMKEYELTKKQVYAALRYAAKILSNEEVAFA